MKTIGLAVALAILLVLGLQVAKARASTWNYDRGCWVNETEPDQCLGGVKRGRKGK